MNFPVDTLEVNELHAAKYYWNPYDYLIIWHVEWTCVSAESEYDVEVQPTKNRNCKNVRQGLHGNIRHFRSMVKQLATSSFASSVGSGFAHRYDEFGDQTERKHD